MEVGDYYYVQFVGVVGGYYVGDEMGVGNGYQVVVQCLYVYCVQFDGDDFVVGVVEIDLVIDLKWLVEQ